MTSQGDKYRGAAMLDAGNFVLASPAGVNLW